MSYPLPGLVVDPQGVSTSVTVTVTDGTGATATVYSDRYGLSPVSNPQTIVARTTVYVPGSGRWTVTANSVAYAVTLEGAEVGSVTIAQSGSGANGGVVENVNTISASGAAQTIPDVTTATLNVITLTANCTFTFPAVAAGKSFSMALIQGGSGSYTVTWPAGVKWPAGTAPTLTLTLNKTDSFSFVSFDGVFWLGYTTGENY